MDGFFEPTAKWEFSALFGKRSKVDFPRIHDPSSLTEVNVRIKITRGRLVFPPFFRLPRKKQKLERIGASFCTRAPFRQYRTLSQTALTSLCQPITLFGDGGQLRQTRADV